MKISDLQHDPNNANKGTERGSEAIESSLRRYGAGRSILLDKNGMIIAGNKTAENAAAAGLTDVIVVKTNGSQLVAVQRTDLDLASDPKARELAVADNRAGELSLEWDCDVLSEIANDLNLEPFFTADELTAVLGLDDGAEPEGQPELPDNKYQEQYGVMIVCATEDNQRDIYDKLMEQGYNCRVVCT